MPASLALTTVDTATADTTNVIDLQSHLKSHLDALASALGYDVTWCRIDREDGVSVWVFDRPHGDMLAYIEPCGRLFTGVLEDIHYRVKGSAIKVATAMRERLMPAWVPPAELKKTYEWVEDLVRSCAVVSSPVQAF